jgi:hypothetical protein
LIPGANVTSCWKLRPFRGRFSTILRSTTVLTVASLVLMGDAPASTVTDSETDPTSRLKLTEIVSWTCNSISDFTTVLNPSFITVIRYSPGSSAGVV